MQEAFLEGHQQAFDVLGVDTGRLGGTPVDKVRYDNSATTTLGGGVAGAVRSQPPQVPAFSQYRRHLLRTHVASPGVGSVDRGGLRLKMRAGLADLGSEVHHELCTQRDQLGGSARERAESGEQDSMAREYGNAKMEDLLSLLVKRRDLSELVRDFDILAYNLSMRSMGSLRFGKRDGSQMASDGQ